MKNCPLMVEKFGNIHRSSLEEVLIQSDLKKYWNLTKDSIETWEDWAKTLLKQKSLKHYSLDNILK